MSAEEYERAEQAALAEVAQLEKQKEEIEARLLQLRGLIASFRALRGAAEAAFPMPRLTEAIRSIFNSMPHDRAVNASNMREMLILSGFNTQNYKNFLASIHSVLKRLEEQNFIERVGDIEFGGGYVKKEKKFPGLPPPPPLRMK